MKLITAFQPFGVKTISEIVNEDYRTADVFKKWGLSYCCGGNVSFEEACRSKNINPVSVINDVELATRNFRDTTRLQPASWSLDFLIDYIINVHHTYTKEVLKNLEEHLWSYVPSHLNKYPYLQKVLDAFVELNTELQKHLEKEEEIIFPYIKQVNHAYKHKDSYGKLFVKTLRKSLDEITMVDYPRIDTKLYELRKAADNYIFNESVCTNHKVIYKKLKEFDDNLVQNKSLETGMLIPKAILIEKELLKL